MVPLPYVLGEGLGVVGAIADVQEVAGYGVACYTGTHWPLNTPGWL